MMKISVIVGSTRQGRFSEKQDKQANVMIDHLTWWTAALKAARER